jgi:peptidoglycan lytic transglycosylase
MRAVPLLVRTGVAAVALSTLSIAVAVPANAGTQTCQASYYTAKEGATTASGQPYHRNAMAAAHKTLKFGTKVKVRYGSKTVTVKINDRGPYVKGRCIDLTPAAFKKLAPLSKGVLNGVKLSW